MTRYFTFVFLAFLLFSLPETVRAYGGNNYGEQKEYYEKYLKRLQGPLFEKKLPSRFKNKETHNYTKKPRPTVKPGQIPEDVTGSNPFNPTSKQDSSLKAQLKRIDEENKALGSGNPQQEADNARMRANEERKAKRLAELKRKEGELFSAIYTGNIEGVRKAFEGGVEPNVRYQDYTPLHYASALRKLDIVMYLLKNPRVDIGTKENQYFSLLYWAAYENHIPLMQKMLERGADPNIKDERGYTPMRYAESKGYNEMVSILAVSSLKRR